MKISRILALVLLVVVGSAVAFASSINDPKVIINGVSSGTPCGSGHNCRDITGLNFSFKIPAKGKGTLFFTNESGQNWTSLTLIVKGVQANQISCSSELFSNPCTVQTRKNGSVAIIFSGAGGGKWPANGIQNGASFAVYFSCNPGCWPGGITVGAHANNTHASGTPEPSTVALMMTGVGMIYSRRKLRKKNPES